jgi:tRNA U34 5-methylaminomethyl-2-thiouridine-forming methyltransferase MnmC
VVDKSALNKTLWTPELLIQMSNSKYDDMVASKQYMSMVTEKVTDQPEIKTYTVAIKEVVKAELKQVSFIDKSAKGTSNKVSGGSE